MIRKFEEYSYDYIRRDEIQNILNIATDEGIIVEKDFIISDDENSLMVYLRRVPVDRWGNTRNIENARCDCETYKNTLFDIFNRIESLSFYDSYRIKINTTYDGIQEDVYTYSAPVKWMEKSIRGFLKKDYENEHITDQVLWFKIECYFN